jgi:arachidonate 5-lipoxygenase
MGVKELVDKQILRASTVGILALVTQNSLTRRQRMSHEHGVAGVGRLRIVDRPTFPDHDFFRPGREFPVRLRHAGVSFRDDAMMVVRSASIKLADSDYEAPLDIEMNTGRISLFATAREFMLLMSTIMNGRGQHFQRFFQLVPHSREASVDGVRRNPSSYTQLYYHSQTIFAFRARDGRTRYCRYRLIPWDRGPESGLIDEADAREVYNQRALPGEPRSRLYLKDEWRERVEREGARYHLQIQLHEWSPSDPEEILSCSRIWDEETHPYHDLAEVEITRVLSFEEQQRMVFSIAHQPPSLGVLAAASIDDYNSINYLRERAVVAKKARLLTYRVFGMDPEVSAQRDPREERRAMPGEPTPPPAPKKGGLRRRVQRAAAALLESAGGER